MTAKDPSPGYTFSVEGFREVYPTVRPLLLAEWPELDGAALDVAEGEPEKIVELLAKHTKHTKVLLRRQLGEIAEVAGVDATGLEGRVIRLIHALEGKLDPVQETLERTQQAAVNAVTDLEAHGRHAVDEVKRAGVDIEATLHENIWRSLLGAVGVGVLIGLVVGLLRGR